MPARRIIPCLDVRDGQVVKGVRFRDHAVVGDILELARLYRDAGADELVFYDITASAEGRVVDPDWVRRVAREIDIPFTVAGGIRSVADARRVLGEGADKISINSPALERPALVGELAEAFGVQCVVVGVDSRHEAPAEPGGPPALGVYQYTGDVARTAAARRDTRDWVATLATLGAGEIVVNCMDADGTKAGYDIAQLSLLRGLTDLPLIASGGAGAAADFDRVFREADVDGALAASIFHRGELAIAELKRYLAERGHEIRPA